MTKHHKAPVKYRDSTVGRVPISRATAAKIMKEWRAAGHKVGYRNGNRGRNWAFFGIDGNHYIERGAIRGPNPRKAPRRAKRAKAGRGKTVTTVTNSKVIRRTNPRVALYATKPGMRRLKYVGHGKFGERGRAVLFGSVAEGNAAGRALRDAFPQALRGWTVSAGADAPPAAERRTRRRRLPQGVDPADQLYREQARRDSAVAHRWLDKHGK